MQLHFESYGDEPTTPLLIAHGLFGSARNWRAIAKRMSAQRPVITADMRNHGQSPWDSNHTYQDMADDLADMITQQGQLCDVLGHSMGGKAAMVLANKHPELVRNLIVADIAPVAYDHSQTYNIDAMRAVRLDQIDRRSAADDMLAKYIDDPAQRAFLLQSLKIDPLGNKWILNLDSLAKNMEAIMGFPNLEGTFGSPTLFLSGGASDYVTSSSKNIINSLFPNCTLEVIEGVGHWLHAEAPRTFIQSCEAFLNVHAA